MSYDVVVVGGGAIGLATAYRLARERQKVCVLDAGELGREASWAGGGLLSPVHPSQYPRPLIDLVHASTELFPELAAELFDSTGVSIELRRTGLVRIAVEAADDADLVETARLRRERSLPCERPAAAELPRLGRALTLEARGALFEPEIAQVRNPRLLKALIQALGLLGVELAPHEAAADLVRSGDRVTGVRTGRRTIEAREVVLAAGAWSGELARRSLGVDLPVEPVRGQMVLIESPSGSLGPVVLGCGGRYLIPRADGRILCGSTLEHVGFDRRSTVEGVRSILDAALRLAPGLAHGRVAATWGGLRPATPDRLPYLGRVPGLAGLVLATGHYRNGLVLTPITAALVEDLVLGRAPRRDLAPFAPGRPLGDRDGPPARA